MAEATTAATFAIVDRATGQIAQIYESATGAATPEAFGGPLGWPETSAHVAVPAELAGLPADRLAAVADATAAPAGYVIVAAAPPPMLKIAVIDLATDTIQHIYDAPAPNQRQFGGPWGWPDATKHVALPDGADTEIVRPVRRVVEAAPAPAGDGYGYEVTPVAVVTYDFEIDPEKRAAKEARLWEALRAKRNALLTECDWTQVADAPLTDEKKAAWLAYRKALRDLPGTVADVWGGVVWPERP